MDENQVQYSSIDPTNPTDPNLPPDNPPQPVLSPEDEMISIIQKQDDSLEFNPVNTNDEMQNIVYNVKQSVSYGKKVITIFEYYDLYRDGVFVGRALQNTVKSIHEINDVIENIYPTVIGKMDI